MASRDPLEQQMLAERVERSGLVKWGHLLRFDPAEIEAWIDGSRRPPAA